MDENLTKLKKWFADLPPAGKVAVIGAGLVIPIALVKKSRASDGEAMSAENYNGLLSDLPGGGGDSSGGSGGDSGKALDSDLIYENQKLTNKITDIMDSFQTYRQDSQSILAEADAAQKAAANEAAFLSSLVGTNIYMDSDKDSDQFAAIFGKVSRAVSDGTISANSGNYALSAIAGLGNNGKRADGTPETGYTVPTTNSGITAEIVRTQLVTQNRQNAGLDTSLQNKYMQQLTAEQNNPPRSNNGGNPSPTVTQVVSSVRDAVSSVSNSRDRDSTPSRNATRESMSDRIAEKRSRLK